MNDNLFRLQPKALHLDCNMSAMLTKAHSATEGQLRLRCGMLQNNITLLCAIQTRSSIQ